MLGHMQQRLEFSLLTRTQFNDPEYGCKRQCYAKLIVFSCKSQLLQAIRITDFIGIRQGHRKISISYNYL